MNNCRNCSVYTGTVIASCCGDQLIKIISEDDKNKSIWSGSCFPWVRVWWCLTNWTNATTFLSIHMIPAIDTMALVTPHTCMYTRTSHTHTFILYVYYTKHLSRKVWWIFGCVVNDKNYICFTLDTYIAVHWSHRIFGKHGVLLVYIAKLYDTAEGQPIHVVVES